MQAKNVTLIEPCVELVEEFMSMVREFQSAGEKLGWQEQSALEGFEKYVQQCQDWQLGRNLPADWVPASTFWLLRNDGTILGTSSLRHRLNERLKKIGGHIGYEIRRGQRRKGYGTIILRLTLQKAKQLRLKRVLVTCDDGNIASAKIIERNGGILEDKYFDDELKQPKRRYWIELEPSTTKLET